jgi:tetratricopeptide (TPR) repeat protein
VRNESFLACAAEVAQSIEALEGHSEVMSLIAVRYAEAGLLETAVELANGIEDPYVREQALANIAPVCVEAGDADYARKLLEMIEDPSLYDLAIEQMALKYAEVGDIEKALETAQELTDSAPALSAIALRSADVGLFDKAVEIAQAIEYADLKTAALYQLAAKALHEGDEAEAARLLLEATESAEEIEFAEARIHSLIELASLYKEMGRAEQAFKLLSRAGELCDEFEDRASTGLAFTFPRDEALVRISTGFAQLRSSAEVQRVLEKIENPFQYASALAGVALEAYKAGRSEEALKLLTEALEIGREEEVYGQSTLRVRDFLLEELAPAYATVGRSEEAAQICGMISSIEQRQRALTEVGKTCVRAGNHGRVFQLADLIGDAYARVQFFLEMSSAFMEAGQQPLADSALSQAHTASETIDRAYDKALAQSEIALRFGHGADKAKISGRLFQALTNAARIGDSYNRARVLVYLSDKYREAGLEPGEREQAILQEISPGAG